MNTTGVPAAAKGGLAALAASELFSGLFAEELEQLQSIQRRAALEPGMTVFRFGEPAVSIFVVEAGRLALTIPLTIRGTSRNVTVQEKGPGSVVGWSAVIPPHLLTLGAHAVEASTVLSFDRGELEALFDRQPRLKLVVISNLAQVIAGRLCLLEGILLRDLQRWLSETCS